MQALYLKITPNKNNSQIKKTTTKKERKKRANKLLDHSLGSRDLSRTGYDMYTRKREINDFSFQPWRRALQIDEVRSR
jgi:hypothetical protein